MSTINKPNYILEANLFCKQQGMKPTEIPFPKEILNEEELNAKRKEYEEILSVIQFFGRKLLDSLQGTPLLLSVSDEKGHILHMMGDETIKHTVNQLGIRPGIRFTQEGMGTNVVSLSLKHSEQPIQVIGPDHYHEYLHQTACYATAFRYTDINNLLGSIIIMTAIQFQNELMLTMLSTTVDSIERELLLRKQNRRLDIMNQILMENTRNGIIITDKEGQITDFNHSSEELTGLTKDCLLGNSVLSLQPIGNYIHDVLHQEVTYEDIQISFVDMQTNARVVCLFDAFPIYDENKRLSGAFGQFRNITERYEAEERYTYLANHDDLTGLPNRRFYKKKLESLLEEANQEGLVSKLAIIYLDLDRFKLVNDTLGHTNGDFLLKQVAERLKDTIDTHEYVARMGGDEFMFLLPSITDEEQIRERVERIIQLLQHPFNMNGYEFHITASIGVALYPEAGADVDTLMIHADTAMYKAKQNGKNQYAIYSADMHTKSPEKLTMETSLRRALDNGEFTLFYQPQVDINTGKIEGVEALIRWQHPEKGLIHPSEFIPLAEETGLITKLDEWVLLRACQQNKAWQEQGLPSIRVAVNLSSQQFANQYLVEKVKQVLAETGLDPQYLELEITETMTMDVEHSIPTLQQLHDLGVKISIDDFGTGYSSLNYLHKCAIDRLKIDQSFVRNLFTDSSYANIVSTVIVMAHHLGLEVIGEGVEEEEQLRFLQEKECNQVQGYYFSRPLPADELVEQFTRLQHSFNEMIK